MNGDFERRKQASDARSGAHSGHTWGSVVLHNKVVVVLVALILVVPLLSGTARLDTLGKMAAFEVLGAVLLILMLSHTEIPGLQIRLKQTLNAGPNLPIFLLTVLGAVSSIFSPYKSFSLAELLRISFCAVVFFAVVYQVRRKEHLEAIVGSLLLATALVSILSLAQMGMERAGTDVTEGTFGSHELLGSFLMLMLPLALALGLTDRGKTGWQIAAQVVALLAAACLLTARTRSAWLGGAVSLITLSLLAARFSSAPSSLGRRKHFVVGPLLILAGAIGLFVLMSQMGSLLGHRAGTLTHLSEDGSFQARVRMWRGTARMIAARPIFGWGVGTYPVRQSAWTLMGNDTAHVLTYGTSHSNIAHNFYLQTAADLGLTGLGLYLAVVFAFFIRGTRALKGMAAGLNRAVLMGCLAAMSGQVIDAFGSPAYNFASVSLFQWIVMGLGMLTAGLSTPSRAAPGVSARPTHFAAV